MTGGKYYLHEAVENEIVAGRSLIAQDYKDVASVILLDQELANSLLDLLKKLLTRL